MWLVLFIGVIVLLAAVIWITRITVQVEYKNYSGNNELHIRFLAWFGLIRYTVNLPVLKLSEHPIGLVVEGEKGNKGQNEMGGEMTAEELLSQFQELKEMFSRIIGAGGIIVDFLSTVSVRKFEWKTAFGSGDAALTGMAAGAIWAVKGSICGLMNEYLKLKVRPVLTVTPYFQFKTAGTMLTCMITFRAGKAMSAGIRLFTHWKGKKRELLSKTMQTVPHQES